MVSERYDDQSSQDWAGQAAEPTHPEMGRNHRAERNRDGLHQELSKVNAGQDDESCRNLGSHRKKAHSEIHRHRSMGVSPRTPTR